jgi:hypothetical protein
MTGDEVQPVAQQPTSLARVRAGTAYHDACERLANASVAWHKAKAEFDGAMTEFAAAQGAARSQGIAS